MTEERVRLHRLKSVAERQTCLAELVQERVPGLGAEDPVFDFGRVDPKVYERACEGLVGHVSIPVGIAGPLNVHYREYEEADDGELLDTGQEFSDSFHIPVATHEGGLNASLNRGIKAANECGGVRTHVLASSMTRGSCYVFENTEQAHVFGRWARANLAPMQAWLEDPQNPHRDAEMKGIPLLSRHGRLRGLHTYLMSNTCHVVFRYTTGDACGQNMSTRNTYMLHAHFILPHLHADTGIVPAHFFLEANTGGDKKVSHLYHTRGGHGTSVAASVILTEEVLGRTLKCNVDEVLKLMEVGGQGAALSGMIGVSCNPANVIAAVYAATGQDLACVGTSSMATAAATECPEGVLCTLRLPNLEVGTVGGGTGLPHQRRYLEIMGCRGAGKIARFAQVVTAAALCLELSTTSAMAAAGSFSFYMAHLERGGMKRVTPPARVSEQVLDQLREEESR